MSILGPKRQDARISSPSGGPSQTWGSSTTSRPLLPSSPIRGPFRAGGPTHRPYASLSSYPPSNATANSSIVSLISSVEPRRAIIHAYNVVAGDAEVQFLISLQGTSQNNEYEMSLTVKSGGIEQSLGGKETAIIPIDPSMLKFHIFIFPKPSLPEGSLYCVRVWMEAGLSNVQHRVFSDDNLWVARDPAFHTIEYIALTQLAPAPPTMSDTYWSRVYRGFVGRAPVDFIPSLTLLSTIDSVYSVAMDYESGGVKRRVFDNIKLRLHCRLQDIQFIIYTVPLESSLSRSNHRLRVWIRGQNRIHTRLFKSDDFRLGAYLDFARLERGTGHVVFAAPDPHSPSTGYCTSLISDKEGASPVDPAMDPEEFPPAYSITHS